MPRQKFCRPSHVEVLQVIVQKNVRFIDAYCGEGIDEVARVGRNVWKVSCMNDINVGHSWALALWALGGWQTTYGICCCVVDLNTPA